MIKAVIFDQDGVIFDNEPLVSKSYELLLREYGKDPIYGPTGLIQPVGVRGDIVWNQIRKVHGITEDTDILREKRRVYHLGLLNENLVPMAGVIDLLKLLKSKGIKIALATGSSRKIVDRILSVLKITQYFDVIVSGNDYIKSKPDPEAFLLASTLLKIDPRYCLVVEDSVPGVQAGKKAGMKVIAVPTVHSKNDDYSLANKVVQSLEEIDWEMIESI